MRFVAFLIQQSSGELDSNLVSNIEIIDSNVTLKWMMEAEEVMKMVPSLEFKLTAEKLVKFFGILKSNSYMIKDEKTGFCIGAQLIDLHSRVNHSCEPNCVSSYDGAEVFLIALRDIQAGEEILVSYTDTSKPRNIRKRYLQENLYFDCLCSLCTSNEFSIPEALRTSIICSCGKELYGIYFIYCSIIVYHFILPRFVVRMFEL